MGVKFTAKFTEMDIRNFISQQLENFDRIILERFQQIGEQFVSDARIDGDYIDRTRNLRGSIGYVILKDGKEVFGNFEGTKEGQTAAKQLIELVYGNYKKGYALVVVAGMNYAIYVEAKGRDVLTGSSQRAAANLRKSIDRVKAALNKRR